MTKPEERLIEALKDLIAPMTCASVDKTCEGLESPCAVCRVREVIVKAN